MRIYFPHNFLWGSSISSYQTEGGNTNSDWFLWEKKHSLERAGKSTDHFHLFKKDISLASLLSHNAFRFSLEWSRIYPQKKLLFYEALNHYREVIHLLKENNIIPIVTLHHFTNPIWFAQEGGWLNYKLIDEFIDYVRNVVIFFKKDVTYWLVFNEPLVYIYNGFIRGIWPPGLKSIKKSLSALKNILKAYILSYEEIKNIYRGRTSYVSLAKNMRVFMPCFYMNFFQNNLYSFLRSYLFNFNILNYLTTRKYLDFIALNYYCGEFVKGDFSLWGRECKDPHHSLKRNALGWLIYPQGLYQLLKRLKSYFIPIIITENGTAGSSEDEYLPFLISHIKSIAKAISEKVLIKGYFWWSLIDNFEWHCGYKYKFGLASVDFNDFSRKIRPFAWEYKKICENNYIEVE